MQLQLPAQNNIDSLCPVEALEMLWLVCLCTFSVLYNWNQILNYNRKIKYLSVPISILTLYMSSFENSSIGRTSKIPLLLGLSLEHLRCVGNNCEMNAMPASPRTPLPRDSLRIKSSAWVKKNAYIFILKKKNSFYSTRQKGNFLFMEYLQHISKISNCEINKKKSIELANGD